ncbi:hypothetical protein [Rothia sp. 11254D007CT]
MGSIISGRPQGLLDRVELLLSWTPRGTSILKKNLRECETREEVMAVAKSKAKKNSPDKIAVRIVATAILIGAVAKLLEAIEPFIR